MPGIHVILVMLKYPPLVIPGPAEGRNPESILPLGLWIPDSRFAASGMTTERFHSFSSFLTFPDAIWARCCSVTGRASSHFRPGSFFT